MRWFQLHAEMAKEHRADHSPSDPCTYDSLRDSRLSRDEYAGLVFDLNQQERARWIDNVDYRKSNTPH